MNEEEMVDWFSGNPPIGTWVLVWVRAPESMRGMYIGKCDFYFGGLEWVLKGTFRNFPHSSTDVVWTYAPKPPYGEMPPIKQKARPA